MRVKFLALGPSIVAVLAGCGGSTTGPRPVSLPVPAAGRYQATLMGYGVRSCDDTLSEPVGALEVSTSFGFLSEGQVQISGARIWPYGAVSLQPGDPSDLVLATAWRGSAEVQAIRGGCTLGARVSMLYFPVDAEHGNLNAQINYSAVSGTCTARLPCENLALWSLTHYE